MIIDNSLELMKLEKKLYADRDRLDEDKNYGRYNDIRNTTAIRSTLGFLNRTGCTRLSESRNRDIRVMSGWNGPRLSRTDDKVLRRSSRRTKGTLNCDESQFACCGTKANMASIRWRTYGTLLGADILHPSPVDYSSSPAELTNNNFKSTTCSTSPLNGVDISLKFSNVLTHSNERGRDD